MSNYTKLSTEELLKEVEKLQQELKSKKYGLVWDSEKEPEKVVLDCENNLPILERVKDKAIKTDNSDDNILIEGDNYHALTVLNYTHKGKIDVIYIDPPYNTGNKDFIYNDKFVEKEDGYKHSKWLNFMEKRLRLARNLLTEKGVIFISIDNNEYAQLKIICDNIFEEKNFIDTIIWKKTENIKMDSDFLSQNTDYILCYRKSDKVKEFSKEFSDINRFKEEDEKGKYYLRKLDSLSSSYSRGMDYIIEHNGIKYYAGGSKEDYENRQIAKQGKKAPTWLWSKSKYEQGLEDGEIVFNNGNVYNKVRYDGIAKKPYINIQNIVSQQTAQEDLNNIFGKRVFDHPKPNDLIEWLIKLANNSSNMLILDFFAGSGTTGHAVLELNKKDGGNRKFILCTNNENQICEEVTYPRIHNVVKGYKFKGKDKTTLFEQKITFSQLKNINSIIEDTDKIVEENKPKYDEIEKKFEDNTIKITGIKNIDGWKDGLGGNLQYFKTGLIDVERVDMVNDSQKQEITYKAGQIIAIKENTFEEMETNEWYQIFESKDKTRKAAIYFRENLDQFNSLIEKIGNTKTVLYLYSYGRIKKETFQNIGKNIIIEDIPAPILEIYKEINLTLKDNIRKYNLKNEIKRAKQHIENNNKEDGARVLRICIENIIHQICVRNNVSIENKQISFLNDELKRINIFEKVLWEKNKTFIAIGNNASHGDYSGFSIKDVNNFYDHLLELINNFNIK